MVNWIAETALALCGGNGLTLLTVPGLFLAGLGGSVAHCSVMCGPFVLGQVGAGLGRVPAGRLCEWHRLSESALVAYHAGRLTTYTALGAASGLMGLGLAQTPRVRALLLGAAALLFLLMAARRMWPGLGCGFGLGTWVPAGWARFGGGMWVASLAARPGLGRYLRGVLLGFLPCGLLYAALVAAAASPGPTMGAVLMLAFGLGTVPALVLVGIAGQVMARRFSGAARRVAPLVLAVNAVALAVLAVVLV
jgi:sulfite exporter TauE/SafE